jgi:hypothetical protein
MAVLFYDNFENWTSTSTAYPGPWVVISNTSSWGSASTASNVNHTISGVYQTGNAVSTYLAMGFADKATVVCNMRVSFEQPYVNDTGAILWFVDGGTEQCSLRLQPNGYFAVYRGISTAKLGESTNFFSYNNSEYLDIELKIGIHNTTGTVELRVNGVVEINLINQNTRASANNFVNQVRIGRHTQTQAARPYFKHFILMDTTDSVMNDFIGPVDITSLRSNADDATILDWTANTGTRWQAVNQAITDGDTTYVSADTPGDRVLFELTNLPAGVTDVFAVMPQCQIKREQGTTRITKFLMGSGVDTELGSKDLAVGPTYAFRQEPMSVSPFTTDPWDVAEVNGLRLGMEITT